MSRLNILLISKNWYDKINIFLYWIQNMKNNLHKAFTLVELIVVITILAVLATVAFISFQGYTSSSRDSVRLADLKNISKSFEITRTKNVNFPLPDKKVDISSSGTIFQYQWELSQDILKKDLNIFDWGLDPVTKKPYWYAVNTAKNKFQIIWFLENNENITNISTTKTFADNSDKYIKSSGDSLWILLNETTNEIVIQSGSLTQIDIENNTQNYSVIIDKEINTWDMNFIKSQLSFRTSIYESCNSILQHGLSHWDWNYTINPTGIYSEELEVYCDMTTDSGGWTRVAYNLWNSYDNLNKDFMVENTHADLIHLNQANTISSINPEFVSKTLKTQDVMLKSQIYSSDPIIENNNGIWDYDTLDCQWALWHTSRTQWCDNHNWNDNFDSLDRFNIAINNMWDTSIVPYYVIETRQELCRRGYWFCDFEFYLR